jgi:hypothetical protein
MAESRDGADENQNSAHEDLGRYRHWRLLSGDLNRKISQTIPREAFVEVGRALGLRWNGPTNYPVIEERGTLCRGVRKCGATVARAPHLRSAAHCAQMFQRRSGQPRSVMSLLSARAALVAALQLAACRLSLIPYIAASHLGACGVRPMCKLNTRVEGVSMSYLRLAPMDR